MDLSELYYLRRRFGLGVGRCVEYALQQDALSRTAVHRLAQAHRVDGKWPEPDDAPPVREPPRMVRLVDRARAENFVSPEGGNRILGWKRYG